MDGEYGVISLMVRLLQDDVPLYFRKLVARRVRHMLILFHPGSNTASSSSLSVRSWAICTCSIGYVAFALNHIQWLIFPCQACVGAGTHEDLLNEVLLGRSNQEMHLLKEGYQRTYGKNLSDVVRGELSMKTERYVFSAAQ